MIPMPVNTDIQALLTAPKIPAIGASATTTEAFKAALEKVDPDERREKAREAAIQLVSTAFILPVLEDMQEGIFRSEMFEANLVEKRFAPLLNQRIADRIATASNFPLVDALVDRLVGPEKVDEDSSKEAIDVKA